MVRTAAHECHAARHHGVRVDVRDSEAEDANVEVERSLEVGDVQHDVTDLLHLEWQTAWGLNLFELFRGDHVELLPGDAGIIVWRTNPHSAGRLSPDRRASSTGRGPTRLSPTVCVHRLPWSR